MSPRSIEAILADLLQEGPPRESTAVIATEVLALSPDESARELFRALRERPSEAANRTLLPLLGELGRRDDRWHRLVTKSLSKTGRCPTTLKSDLRGLLFQRTSASKDTGPIPMEDVQSPGLSRKEASGAVLSTARKELRIKITTESTNLQYMSALLDVLGAADDVLKKRSCRVILDLSNGDHFFIGGLVVLAAWCANRNVQPIVENAPGATREYLNRVGLEHWMTGTLPMTSLSEQQGWNVAITSVGSRVTEELAAELTSICLKHGWVGTRDRNALVVLFSELIENVRRHAGQNAIAMIGAQYYPKRHKLNVALADTGIGIAESFRRGRNEEAIRRLEANESALYLATSPRVTSKPMRSPDEPGHAGYGLYVASELTVRNGGTFRLTSDDETLLRFRTYTERLAYRRKSSIERHGRWHGTVVSLILDLENLLPIGEVYSTLPAPEGYASEDFFS